ILPNVSPMRRTMTAAEDLPESSTELIARLSAEHSVFPGETTGRHRHSAGVAVADPSATRRRSGVRRLAPVAVGAIVMLVATLILTSIRSPQSAASLTAQSAAVAAASSAQPAESAQPVQSAEPEATTAAANPTPLPSTSQAAAKPAATPAAAATAPKPLVGAAPPPAPVASAADGTQAAVLHGWTLAASDEFAGTSLSNHWTAYDGPGNNGDGTRSPGAIAVQNGIMTIRGDVKGTTGGLSWNGDQRFGKWEVRARFPKGDSQYHPVLLLWPQGEWPQGGEVDFAETTSAARDVNFFLHFSSSNKQKTANRALDLTQWHNYAVEWVDGRITGYIDGQQWFQSVDRSTLPPGQMHLAVQLDYFPEDGSPKPTEMDVDFVRIYR
ncbi:MAG TPA: glycoside hydrolase family 16 protein, partial [Pseudonocardia sp.]